MCELTTALMIAGTAFQAVGQIQSANQSAAMQRYNAQIADQNAQLARQEATVRQQRIRQQGERVLASQLAAYGKAGLDPSSGTPLLVAMETAGDIAFDEQLAAYEGEVDAISYTNQAKAKRASASATRKAGFLSAGASLLSGGVRVWEGLDTPSSSYGATGAGRVLRSGDGRLVGGV